MLDMEVHIVQKEGQWFPVVSCRHQQVWESPKGYDSMGDARQAVTEKEVEILKKLFNG